MFETLTLVLCKPAMFAVGKFYQRQSLLLTYDTAPFKHIFIPIGILALITRTFNYPPAFFSAESEQAGKQQAS